jgi:hypothetical protein
MINTLRIYEELSQALEPKAAQKLASVLGMICEDLQQTVTKAEFNDLRQVVHELAEAQKRTEIRVEELAEAQKRTEAHVGELALRLDQLAVAQKRTEHALARFTLRVDHLAERLDDSHWQLGGLSATVGYTLENEAYRALPPLLERDHGLVLTEPLRRGWLTDAEGRDLEVNILGRGTRAGEPVWIIGESRVQLSQNDVDRFLRRRVEVLQPVCGRVFPVLVTHMVTARNVPDYARERGVAVYLSYQFNAPAV